MKRILFVIPTLTQGGAERVLTTLLNYIDETQYNAAIMVVDMRGDVYSHEIPKDIEIIDLKCSRVRNAVPKIILNVWRYRPDVVMSTLGHLNIAIAMSRLFMPRGVKFVARETIVISEKLKRVKYKKLWKMAHLAFYPTFDRIICQSVDMLQDLADLLGNDKNLILINNPVDASRIRSLAKVNNKSVVDYFGDKNKLYLVAAGRLIEQKGFEMLIEAIASVNNTEIKLAILGHGPLENRLRKLVEHKGLQAQVILMGYQENPYQWISRADAFVLSSFYEGFPNVVLEALACRTPVISSPAPGGTREILENIDGCFLARDVSVSGLVQAIADFSKSDRKEIGDEAIDLYVPEAICREYMRALFT